MHVIGVYDISDVYRDDIPFIMSDAFIDELNAEKYGLTGLYLQSSDYNYKSILKVADEYNLMHTTPSSIPLYQAERIFSIFGLVFECISIVLAIVSIIVMVNFINSIIFNKRKDIGVLRGIGATGRDVSKIFIIISAICSAFISILSIACYYVLVTVTNSLLKEGIVKYSDISSMDNVAMPGLSVWLVLAIIGASALFMFATTISPMIRLGRKKPMEIINQR